MVAKKRNKALLFSIEMLNRRFFCNSMADKGKYLQVKLTMAMCQPWFCCCLPCEHFARYNSNKATKRERVA